jgi:hypothetical protein
MAFYRGVGHLPRTSTIVFLTAAVLAFSSCGTVKDRKSGEVELKATIRDLIVRINDDIDVLHAEYTPAVHELIAIGLPSLRHGVLDLLLSEDIDTRYRAQTVLEGVTCNQYGSAMGRGWKNENQQTAWLELLEEMGSHNYKASLEERKTSYDRWARWLTKSTMSRSIIEWRWKAAICILELLDRAKLWL